MVLTQAAQLRKTGYTTLNAVCEGGLLVRDLVVLRYALYEDRPGLRTQGCNDLASRRDSPELPVGLIRNHVEGAVGALTHVADPLPTIRQ